MVALTAMLKICFELFILNQKANWLETSLEVSMCFVELK